ARDDGRRRDGRNGRRNLRAAREEERLEQRDPRPCVAALRGPLADRLLLIGETRGERPARTEDQRLDRSLRDLHLLRDLAIGQSLPFAEQQRAALLLRHLLQRARQADQLVRVDLVRRNDVLHRLEIVERLDLAATRRRAQPRQADVLRDLVEPGELELGRVTALQPAERIQEGRLRCVLCLFLAAELMAAVRKDLPAVLRVEALRVLRTRSRRLRERLTCTTYGRNCDQRRSP